MNHLKPTALVAACLLVAFVSSAAAPAPVSGRVAHVVDGETLDVVLDGKRKRIRLAGIEAPKNGTYALRSRQALIALCGGEIATVESVDKDRSGVMRARVSCSGSDANAEQIRLGMARVSEPRTQIRSPLHVLEHEAKAAGRGLWAAPVAAR